MAGENPIHSRGDRSCDRARAPGAERIEFESGPLSAWLWHELKKLGLPVVCLDARHAKAALSLQLNKSDRNDALGLAQIVRTGWYREVAVKSLDNHAIRALLTTRAKLVRMRVDLANQIRGVLKPFGLIAGKGGGKPFMERVRALVADGPLQNVAEALLSAWQAISTQINLDPAVGSLRSPAESAEGAGMKGDLATLPAHPAGEQPSVEEWSAVAETSAAGCTSNGMPQKALLQSRGRV